MRNLLASACLFLLLPAPAAAQDARDSSVAVLSSAGQRFVFGQISRMSRDQYMLDTVTGRLWQIVVDKEGHTSLQAVPYALINGQLALAAPTVQDEVRATDSTDAPRKPATPTPK